MIEVTVGWALVMGAILFLAFILTWDTAKRAGYRRGIDAVVDRVAGRDETIAALDKRLTEAAAKYQDLDRRRATLLNQLEASNEEIKIRDRNAAEGRNALDKATALAGALAKQVDELKPLAELGARRKASIEASQAKRKAKRAAPKLPTTPYPDPAETIAAPACVPAPAPKPLSGRQRRRQRQKKG